MHLKVEQKCNFYSYLFNNDIITAFNELDRVCLFYLGWDKGALINDVTQLGVGEKANTWVTLCIKIWDRSCVTSFMYDPLRSGKYIKNAILILICYTLRVSDKVGCVIDWWVEHVI